MWRQHTKTYWLNSLTVEEACRSSATRRRNSLTSAGPRKTIRSIARSKGSARYRIVTTMHSSPQGRLSMGRCGVQQRLVKVGSTASPTRANAPPFGSPPGPRGRPTCCHSTSFLGADFRVCNCSQSAWLILRQQLYTWCLIQYIFFLVSLGLNMSARPVSKPSRRHPLQRYNSPSKGFSGALHVRTMIPEM
jgi:hypothetical protein